MKDNHSCSFVRGLLSGLVATLPMTAAMIALHRRLPKRERYPLPPALITEKLSKRAGVAGQIDQRTHLGVTIAAHFSFGAAAGALYPICTQSIPAHPLARGIGYGLFVWIGSYLGLLPALRILAPATEHPPRRNALMITAHVVWGATLGLLENRLRRRDRHDKHPSSGSTQATQVGMFDAAEHLVVKSDPTGSGGSPRLASEHSFPTIKSLIPSFFATLVSMKALFLLFLSLFVIGCNDPDRPENPPLVNQNEIRPEQITQPVSPQTNNTNVSK